MFFLLFHALKNENKNSGQNRETFPERADAKNKLMCSICLKEFKSLPALNGHMRSHGGVRASPNFKQVAVHLASVFDTVLLCWCLLALPCFALLSKTCSSQHCCVMSYPMEVEMHIILFVCRLEVLFWRQRQWWRTDQCLSFSVSLHRSYQVMSVNTLPSHVRSV